MISIITVCYNSEETLERTFRSVLFQTILPDEYIVIDGLSEDNTLDIIKKYESLFIRKGVCFKYISEKDEGIYDAMNKGIDLCTQTWIHFLNSDDFYANELVLEEIRNDLYSTKASVVYGQVITKSGNKDIPMMTIRENKLSFYSLFGCPIFQPATFFNRSLFYSGYRFDTSYQIAADYKLFVQLIQAQATFLCIPRFTTFFSDEGISSLELNNLALDENKRLLKECKRFSGFSHLRKNRFLFKIVLNILKVYCYL